jgi:hypothetical protein
MLNDLYQRQIEFELQMKRGKRVRIRHKILIPILIFLEIFIKV